MDDRSALPKRKLSKKEARAKVDLSQIKIPTGRPVLLGISGFGADGIQAAILDLAKKQKSRP